jgi:CheY-like chemotaxis protein
VQHGRPATRGVDQSLSEGSPGDLPGLARSDRWPLPLLDRVLSLAGVRLVELSDAETDAGPPAGLVGRPADTARPGPADQPHAGRQPAKLPRVLLVDDSASMRRVLRGLLEDAGIEVVGEAVDGADGVELAVALRPEVVLMDWRMPRLDGVQATARIRQRLPEVQVVMFSSLEGAGIGVAAREAGASAFVSKGASPDQLCGPCWPPRRQVLDPSRQGDVGWAGGGTRSGSRRSSTERPAAGRLKRQVDRTGSGWLT